MCKLYHLLLWDGVSLCSLVCKHKHHINNIFIFEKLNACLLLECLFCVVKVPKVQFNIGKKWVKIVEGEWFSWIEWSHNGILFKWKAIAITTIAG